MLLSLIQKTNYNTRNVNRIPICCILLSLGAWDGVFSVLLSITSTLIETVPNSEACSYNTIQNQTKSLFCTNCYQIRPCYLSFLMDYESLCLPKYSIRYLLHNPHHCDDAIWWNYRAKISLPFYFFIFVFCGRAFASSQMNMEVWRWWHQELRLAISDNRR